VLRHPAEALALDDPADVTEKTHEARRRADRLLRGQVHRTFAVWKPEAAAQPTFTTTSSPRSTVPATSALGSRSIRVRAKLMEVVLTVRLIMVPRVGVEPTRPYGQRILSPSEGILPDLTKRDEPIPTGLAAVKVMLRPVTSRDKMSSS
jgi:hypothetical protein